MKLHPVAAFPFLCVFSLASLNNLSILLLRSAWGSLAGEDKDREDGERYEEAEVEGGGEEEVEEAEEG